MTMNDTMKLMFREFVFNEKPEKMIADVNGLALPEDYLAFMQEHDGGEGPLGENNYGRFFKLEELKEINDEYDVSNSWPGYIVIGGIDDALWAYNPEKGNYCQIDRYRQDKENLNKRNYGINEDQKQLSG